MDDIPQLPKRKSIRLKEFDYSSLGAYYLTICAANRQCLFGEITGEEIKKNSLGEMIESCWNGLPQRFFSIILDEFIVMPDHVHGIIFIDNDLVGVPLAGTRENDTNILYNDGQGQAQPLPERKVSLSDVVGVFKSISAIQYLKTNPVNGKLWQRNYYERIIRNDKELNKFREYIQTNPLRWSLKNENR